MWKPTSVQWNTYPALPSACKAGRLVLVVGNGVSRLAKAPSWNDLFLSSQVVHSLREMGIDPGSELARGISPLELAELSIGTARKHLVWALNEWARPARPTLVHRLIFRLLRPASVYTLNFDTLLEDARAAEGLTRVHEVIHVHGSWDDPSTMVLSESDYERFNPITSDILLGAAKEAGALLFVGYGHSFEDSDLRRALAPERLARAKIDQGKIFSLISSHDDTKVLRERLRRMGTQPLVYELPANPTCESRTLALAWALRELAECALEAQEVQARAGDVLRDIDDRMRRQEDRNRSTTVVVGLAAMNRIAEPCSFKGEPLKDAYPSRSRKNVRASEIEEPGGPGLIVATVLSVLGHAASLVSAVADDADGLTVRGFLSSPRTEDAVAIDLDHFQVYRRWERPSMETWRSYVLLDPRPWGQRTFLDRFIPPNQLPTDWPALARAAELVRDDPPQFIYFDKFFGEAVKKLLINPGNEPLSESTFTVYETGSDGDKSREYSFEERIANGSVNFVIASFRFARDYLARRKGRMADDLYGRLAISEPFEAREEADLIREQIVPADSHAQRAFVDAIRRGAQQWLRKTETGPRIVVVTLHEHGSMWILIDEDKHGLVSTEPDEQWYNFSAGDVFRGAFLAGMIECRGRTPPINLDSSEALTKLCDIANRCAGIKVRSRSLGEALPGIRDAYSDWRQTL